ncbi:MAG TPA: hypothetical protein PLI95_25025, partial [Polyangiaceae bacterium]|nr:hypothetical protein [Polyangiaceae bacterium]
MRLVCWSSIACVLLVPACKRADNPSPTASTSASSAAETLPSPPVRAWETARRDALGTAAKPPAFVSRAPATSPDCAVPSVARRLDAKHDAQRVELDKQLKATAKDRVAALSKAYEPFMLGDAFRRT